MELHWDHIPYFAGIAPHVLERLSRVAHTCRYQAGAVIFNEGERCAGFHMLVEGMVRVYRISPEGRMHTLSLLRPSATFNEVAAVDGRTNPYNAVAVMQSQVARISHAQFLALLQSEPELMQSYMQAMAQLNRDYIERLEDMTFRTIPSRLAKLFLHEAMYADQIADTPTKLTQEDLASILGTTREVVGRALRGLMNVGLLKKRGREIFIADRAGLEHLAHTNEMPTYVPECPLPQKS